MLRIDVDQFSIPIQTSGDNLIWIDLLLSSIGFTSVNNAHLKPSYTDTNLQYTVWLVYIVSFLCVGMFKTGFGSAYV